MVTKGSVYCTYSDACFVLRKPWYTLLVAPLCPTTWLISASHRGMMLLGHTTRVPQHFTRPSVQKNVYEQGCRGSSMVICGWTPLSLPLCHSVHAWMDSTVHTPSSQCPWMVKATVTSMDTVTEGYAQWSPSMDGHGWSWLL